MSTRTAGLRPGPKGANGVRTETTDHIITISTASLTDSCNAEPVKGVASPVVSKPQSVGSGVPLATTFVPDDQVNPIEQRQKQLYLCRLSQLVSYQNNIADVQHRKGRRLHGLQLPLHPLQLFGWLVLLLFGVASFWVLIPAFHARIQGPLYGLITGLYLVHIASHLTALLTDPADKELRRVHRNDRIVPEFDRTKHSHVIENGRCHLCNIRTSSSRTKHCSVCNKCVGKFDHHCKWLNHCIGSRNYVAFLMCVVSAVVATLVIVAAVVAQIVFYYVQPEWLSFYWCPSGSSHQMDGGDYINITLSLGNGTMMLMEQQPAEEEERQETMDEEMANLTISTLPTLLENFTALIEASTTQPGISLMNHTVTQPVVVGGIGVNETIFLLLLGVLGLLAAVSAGLLLHLCFFHIYISFLGLTTYEYIRNHRQAQEAKAKQLVEGAPKNGSVHFSASLPEPHNPSKSLPTTQLYCCSSAPHPNQQSQEAVGQTEQSLRLHCCASSREFHQSRQAIYVCSLLEETVPQVQVEQDTLSSFHCCSSFAASSLQRRVSVAKGSLISAEPRPQRPATYLQYTERCTLCTFRLRRGSGSGAGSSGAVSSAGGSSSTRTLTSQTGGSSSSATAAGNISKHQRWRRKWNCCASVPDSPDVPNDLLAALTFREREEAAAAAKLNAQELPIQFIRTLNGGLDQELPPKTTTTATPTPPRSSRLRHMLRLLGRYRRPRCRHGAHHGIAAKEHQHQNHGGSAIKQNQIRPLQLQAAPRGYANSTATPTPPASSPSRSSLESSELSTSTSPSCGHKELMLLPTSVIRDDSVTTYTLTLPPALPPPTRRKMNQTTQEMAELAESLGFASNLQHNQHSQTNSRTLPSLGNVYRRQRRKHFLRTRSPTLSPIHESGLSNPTSPQPLRHHHHHQNLVNSNSKPAKATSSPLLNRSSGSGNSSALLVQNLCSLAGETLRKTASNSSLQSLSSNSSST
ncbi:uncharacterized protein LOC108148906 [Drosophila elegans]|uniref:uncharacterized protein LOC108148906 n=1 Tax=Drosophila elegans TaxID=30023 RepID=UPI0007E78111|nr:uncharacterized protein LOC108148906 [Drosophila elegans]